MINSDIQNKQKNTISLPYKIQLFGVTRKKDATAYEKKINELEVASLLMRKNKI